MLNINPFRKKTNTNSSGPDPATSTNNEPKKKGVFGGLKDMAVEKMMQRQLKQLPAAQREVLMGAMKKNPEFFEMIANKIKDEEKKNGGNQMAASMKIMREHQGELMKIISRK